MNAGQRTRPTAALIGLTVVYACAIAFLSLYPWQGWRPWSSLSALAFAYLVEPWPRYWTAFDFATNLFAYVPLGTLLVALVVRRWSVISAMAVALIVCSLLSLTLETLQILIPGRVPSRADWVANVLGGAMGALLAALIGRHRLGRWPVLARGALPLAPESSLGLLLLATWFAAQLYPQSMSFATGEVLDPLAAWLGAESPQVLTARIEGAHVALAEALAVAFTVVAIALIVMDLLRPGVHPTAPVVAAIAIAAFAKSAASAWLLGPGAGFAWISAGAQGGILVGALVSALLAWLRAPARLLVAAVAVAIATALFNSAGPNPYFYSMMAQWDQGRWVNLNGVLRGIALVWPFAAIAYCLLRRRSQRGHT